MLHATVAVFLESVTEREFDPTVLALLASQGFTNIHFIHGAFEFGKDVIAQRVNERTGVLEQYAIQSKAGNLGVAEWRAVRPQLDEAGYNTQAHPGYDTELPRVAVLLTTGRLKGAAASDAQQYAESKAKSGDARVEVWDQDTLAAWIATNPELGALDATAQTRLQRLLADISSDTIDEPTLEKNAREWSAPGGASLEAAVLVHALREHTRVDLASACALHLYRRLRTLPSPDTHHLDSARRLFLGLAEELLDTVRPVLERPALLAGVDGSPAGGVTYAVTTVRTTEILALAAILSPENAALRSAVTTLARDHPGAARPVSDQFAVALIPVVIVLAQHDPDAARTYLETVIRWLMGRSDFGGGGLGLGTMTDTPREVMERLFVGAGGSTTLEASRSSYILTVVLDLCLTLGELDLLEAVIEDARVLGLTPCTTMAVGADTFQRGGGNVLPVLRMSYDRTGRTHPVPPATLDLGAEDVMLLVASCRSRHYTDAIATLLAANQQGTVQE